MCVVGPSHSGNSNFVLELLDRRHKELTCLPNRVIWCDGIFQPELNITLRQMGHKSHADILPVSDIQSYDIVILDDLIH